MVAAAKRGNMEEKLQRIFNAIEEMGIPLKDEDGNFLCMYDLLRALSDKFQELDSN